MYIHNVMYLHKVNSIKVSHVKQGTLASLEHLISLVITKQILFYSDYGAQLLVCCDVIIDVDRCGGMFLVSLSLLCSGYLIALFCFVFLRRGVHNSTDDVVCFL